MELQVTELLKELDGGDSKAVEKLFPLVYDQLRRVAGAKLQGERPDHTLNATALVHEAYLKLVDQKQASWQNRAHFFAIASQAMRRILINYARERMAEKRGGGLPIVTFTDEAGHRESRMEELIELDEALDKLKKVDERQSKVVEYKFFGGLNQEEIAEVLKLSVPTVQRDWRMARAWLSRELGRG